MSSYLNFYFVTKEDSDSAKPLNIYSVSRNDELYQSFVEHNVPFIGTDDKKINTTEVTNDMLDSILTDVNKSISNTKKHIRTITDNLPEKASERIEMLYEVESFQEYLESLIVLKHRIQCIQNVVFNLEFTDFSKLLCNID